jgi:hypothetical protein
LKQAFSHGENDAVVGGGRENCMGGHGLSKPHAGRAGERSTDTGRHQLSSMTKPAMTPPKASTATTMAEIFSQLVELDLADFPSTHSSQVLCDWELER